MPYGTRHMRAKRRQALHPLDRQAAQDAQLGRLGVGAVQRNVLAHGVLQQIVVGQGRARRQAQQLERAALGRAVFEPLLGHQAGRSLGDLGVDGCRCHGAAFTRHCDRNAAGQGLCPYARLPGHPRNMLLFL